MIRLRRYPLPDLDNANVGMQHEISIHAHFLLAFPYAGTRNLLIDRKWKYKKTTLN